MQAASTTAQLQFTYSLLQQITTPLVKCNIAIREKDCDSRRPFHGPSPSAHVAAVWPYEFMQCLEDHRYPIRSLDEATPLERQSFYFRYKLAFGRRWGFSTRMISGLPSSRLREGVDDDDK